jgi:Leucine-rich repeat (LRR) protein
MQCWSSCILYSDERLCTQEGVVICPSCAFSVDTSGMLSRTRDPACDVLSCSFLALSNKGIAAIAEGSFDGMARLQILDLGANRLASLPAHVFRDLTSLEQLKLDVNSISNISQGTFSTLSSLTSLELGSNLITGLLNNTFFGLSSLKELSIDNNRLAAIPISAVFEGLNSLSRLRLSGNNFGYIHESAFSGALSRLENLDLYYCNIKNISVGAFYGLHSLISLGLDRNMLTMLPKGCFRDLNRLEYLSCTQNQLNTLEAGVFVGLGGLQVLSLGRNKLETISDNTLEGLGISLKTVGLYDNKLVSITSSAFARTSGLVNLDLGANQLTRLPQAMFSNMSYSFDVYGYGNPLQCVPERMSPLRGYSDRELLPLCPYEVRGQCVQISHLIWFFMHYACIHTKRHNSFKHVQPCNKFQFVQVGSFSSLPTKTVGSCEDNVCNFLLDESGMLTRSSSCLAESCLGELHLEGQGIVRLAVGVFDGLESITHL